MRTFWKYFLIVLLLLLGLFAAGVIYLFFVPGSHLFGIQYISINEHWTSDGYVKDDIHTVTVNARDYELVVRESDTEEISLFINAMNTGFVNVKHSTLDVDITKSNGHLTFNVSEPYGATIISDSRVVLRLPKSKAFNINLSNLSGATFIEDELSINNLSYKTEYGNMSIAEATISGDISLDIHNANVTATDSAKIANNNVTLKANSGKLDLSKFALGEIDIEKNNHCVLLVKSATRIHGNFETAGGRIEAETVGAIELNSSDTNVYITKELTNGGNIFLTKGGKVDIAAVYSALMVETNNGSISISKSSSPLNLTSQHGDINVTEATVKVTASNIYGAINVAFSDTAESNRTNNQSRKLIATSANGKITCTGADNVEINATDNARVSLTMHDIVGTNTINGANGAIDIVVPAYQPNTTNVRLPLVLTFKSDRNVLVNLAQLDITGVTQSTDPILVNCTVAVADTLDVTTKGLLTILDTVTAAL